MNIVFDFGAVLFDWQPAQRVRQRLGEALRQHGDTDDFLHEAVLDILSYTPRFLATDRDVFRRLVTRIVENTLRGQSEFYSRLRRDRGRSVPLPDDSVLDLDAQRRTGTTDLDRLGGLFERIPFLAFVFFIGGLSVIGMPGTPGFDAAHLVLEAAIETFGALPSIATALGNVDGQWGLCR